VSPKELDALQAKLTQKLGCGMNQVQAMPLLSLSLDYEREGCSNSFHKEDCGERVRGGGGVKRDSIAALRSILRVPLFFAASSSSSPL
jgi:hypothetical protein